MNKQFRWIGALGFLLMAVGSAAAEDAASALPAEAAQLQQKADQLKSYKASFALTAKEENGKEFKMEGTMLYQQPNRRHMEMKETGTEGAPQQLVSDGKTEWQYYPEGKAAYKINNPPSAPGPHRAFADIQPGTVRFIGKTAEGLSFEAEPLPDVVQQAPVKVEKVRLTLGEKDGLVRTMALLDEKGEEVLTQKFFDIETNVPVSDTAFQFTVPEGVSVMEVPVPGTEQ